MKKYALSVSVGDRELCFIIEGRIDSTSIRDFNDTVVAERRRYPHGRIVFDCSELEYISSAGLRVLLTLKKKERNPIRLINVSPEVHETLEVTGFSRLLEVFKTPRDLSEADVQKMGYTGNITVYRMGEDTLLKVYSDGTSLDAIEQERKYAHAAFLSGVPTLIAYDVVTYKGQYGMLYELVKAATVASLIEATPWKMEQYAVDMGNLLRTIHKAQPEPGILPKTSAIYEGWARRMSTWLYPQEIDKLCRLIHVIPEMDTMVYGNFHPRNVFIQHGEPLLINMAGISCGNPIFDLGAIYMAHASEMEQMFQHPDIKTVQAKKFWDVMIRAYFGTTDASVIKKQEDIIQAVALLRSALSPAATPMSGEEAKPFIVQARRDLLPAVDYLAVLLSSARF
ncbi:MAG: STAS domain-containing protein [Fretibacterium sp.]|nr:STAS domain-containing protein [Fretibacterium sp.]